MTAPYFITLAAIREPPLVISTIARTLNLREQPGETPKEALAQHLRDKRMLLLLDNFEQVVEAGSMISELLAACPGVEVLVTSREPLRLSGEREYPVPSLEEADALALFTERALAIRPDFSANSEVAEICRRSTLCRLRSSSPQHG